MTTLSRNAQVAGLLYLTLVRHYGTREDQRLHSCNVGRNGPWEVRGEGTLQLSKDTGKSNFSAILTMVRSGSQDVDDPSTRISHTHHLNSAGLNPLSLRSLRKNNRPHPRLDIRKDRGRLRNVNHDVAKTLLGSDSHVCR
jgi:hypothetical protein